MSSSTEDKYFRVDDTEYVVSRVVGLTEDPLPLSTAGTIPAAGLWNRFNSLFLPLMVAASIATPIEPRTLGRTFSRAHGSRSVTAQIPWQLDEWAYTTETVTAEQIRSLNALLALPMQEGFSVELDDR